MVSFSKNDCKRWICIAFCRTSILPLKAENESCKRAQNQFAGLHIKEYLRRGTYKHVNTVIFFTNRNIALNDIILWNDTQEAYHHGTFEL